jgi:alpha-amylase
VTAITFYFQVHQPYRLQRLAGLGADAEAVYFDDGLNRMILERVVERCYVPMNQLLLEAIEENEGRFRVAFALTGTVLDQLEAWSSEGLESFQRLAETGCVEFVCETAYHSLAALGEPTEFRDQVVAHRSRLTELFGTEPVTFRNTELIFDDRVAHEIEELGFEVLLGEGADHLLAGRSPRRVYRPGGCSRLKLLLRDYLFSDDIAFRFSNREWPQYPLMADTFAEWLHEAESEDAFIGLYMDYETFGEHQSTETGIFEFMRHLPKHLLADPRVSFATPAEVARSQEPVEELFVPEPISWADAERDVTAWLGNPMQQTAHEALYALAGDVRRAAQRGHGELMVAWRRLTTSDHVYYMSTKHQSDGDVHEYFTPYDSPHDSFMVFMDVLDDLGRRVRAVLDEEDRKPKKSRATR